MSPEIQSPLFDILKARFEANMRRHEGLNWPGLAVRLLANAQALASLQAMEASGGEPDVIGQDPRSGQYLFCDCSRESPIERRSLCYDAEALNKSKENKPTGSAVDIATRMGGELLEEHQDRALQQLGEFDLKTSSWVRTPEDVRTKGGALFCDRRYGRIFTYHNGADTYFGARGFRALLRV